MVNREAFFLKNQKTVNFFENSKIYFFEAIIISHTWAFKNLSHEFELRLKNHQK
jgi:hypothetical protein